MNDTWQKITQAAEFAPRDGAGRSPTRDSCGFWAAGIRLTKSLSL